MLHGVMRKMQKTCTINMSSDYYVNRYKTNKQKQKIQNRISKLESTCRIKLAVIKTKCNDNEYTESCHNLWCELDEIADNIIDLKIELCKYDKNTINKKL
jgi:hypothetical protein